jgi:hypothetical protein
MSQTTKKNEKLPTFTLLRAALGTVTGHRWRIAYNSLEVNSLLQPHPVKARSTPVGGPWSRFAKESVVDQQ